MIRITRRSLSLKEIGPPTTSNGVRGTLSENTERPQYIFRNGTSGPFVSIEAPSEGRTQSDFHSSFLLCEKSVMVDQLRWP